MEALRRLFAATKTIAQLKGKCKKTVAWRDVKYISRLHCFALLGIASHCLAVLCIVLCVALHSICCAWHCFVCFVFCLALHGNGLRCFLLLYFASLCIALH